LISKLTQLIYYFSDDFNFGTKTQESTTDLSEANNKFTL